MRDSINSPQHYRFAGFEAIDIIEAVSRTIAEPKWAFLNSNVLKYVMRWPRKDGLRDLKKARWYLDRLIADMETPRMPSSPDYDHDAVAFRRGDIDRVCGGMREAGEFTGPPNCSPGVGESRHPMAAEGLRLADEQPCNQPRRSESAWSVTWPGEEQYTPCAAYQALVGN